MSLNRSEQRLYDYVEANHDERQFWQYKVRKLASDQPDTVEVARAIEAELWRYYLERSGVVPVLRQAAEGEGSRRVSMRNLAEYLLRIWTPPRQKNRLRDCRDR